MLVRVCVLALVLGVVAADEALNDVKNAVNEVTTTKDGDVYCPVPVVGTKCPGSSVFHYYKCCTVTSNECCFHLQTWVWVVLAVIGVICAASFVLSVLRCLFCRR